MSSRVGRRRNCLCSYVYDAETQLYYLQSRYYDPELGRFINADAFTSTGQGILGNNMYAYCGNNPVVNADSLGMMTERSFGGGGIIAPGYSGWQSVTTSADVVWPKNWCKVVGIGMVSAGLIGIGLSIEAQLQEQFSFKRISRIKSEEEELESIASSYSDFMCKEAARSMADVLKRKGKKAELITITFIESRGYIWSDIRGATISTNGIHMGLLYKGNVYCNVHPSGLPEVAWVADFHATGKKIVTKTPIA